MKEAAGEANLTVITIVLIGVVVAVGVLLVPSLLNGTRNRACCSDAGGVWENNDCGGTTFDRDTYTACLGEAGTNTNTNTP